MRYVPPSWAVLITSIALGAPARVTSSSFVPDHFHTFVFFSYQHTGLSMQKSRFDKVTGTVAYDPMGKTAAVNMEVDMKSVNTGSKLFDKEIQGIGLLDTAHFPTARFKSTHVTFRGDLPSQIEGLLTIKGVVRPVTLTVTSFNQGPNWQKRNAIGANATATIKRSDFNAGEYVPFVSDEVHVSISIEAVAD